jgi:hypothetical protein
MKMTKATVFSLGLIVMNGLGYAQTPNLEDIDKRFEARDEGANDNEKLAKAVGIFQDYKAVGGPIIQMCRIALWGGGLLEGADVEGRKKILRTCIDESVKAVKHSKEQEPHYCLIACRASLAKIANDFERGMLAVKLKIERKDALETTKMGDSYVGGREGGGLLRIFAGVEVNPKANPLGLYNPEEGLRFINIALSADLDMYPPFPEPLSGEDFYENYYYQAQAYVAVGLKNNDKTQFLIASSSLNKILNEIKDKTAKQTLPKGREPETRRYASLMEIFNGKINKCKDLRDWDVCMQHELDIM